MANYLVGPNHSTDIENALTKFHEALTKRWRKEAVEGLGSQQAPTTNYIAPQSAVTAPDATVYTEQLVAIHVNSGECAFVDWAESGQDGSPSSISCSGATGVREDDVEIPDIRGGGMIHVPRHITCPVGDLLAAIEDWAWSERDTIFYDVPLFDAHDVSRLEDAYDMLIRLGKDMGLEAGSDSESGISSGWEPLNERDFPGIVEDVSDRDGVNKDWLESWTGLAADRFKEGFAASTTRTMSNQSGILGCLANCYAERSAIIEYARNNTIYWIDWATSSFEQMEIQTHNLVDGWKTLQGLGTAIAVGGAWSGVAGGVGAAVTLVGFLGENLLPEATTNEGLKYEIPEIMNTLESEISKLNDSVQSHETDLSSGISVFRGKINDTHSYNLELYDLTANSSGAPSDTDGFTADPADILALAKNCYDAAARYEGVLGKLNETTSADGDLADKDGNPSWADQEIIAIRDELVDYIRTTCARYIIAGEQLEDAAEAYAESDNDVGASYDRAMPDWDYSAPDTDWNPGDAADATDRGTDSRYDDHPARGGTAPGEGVETDYEIELSGDRA
ncbi:hypothetical protein GCM10027447_38600 [Glycomyces halotolerans]